MMFGSKEFFFSISFSIAVILCCKNSLAQSWGSGFFFELIVTNHETDFGKQGFEVYLCNYKGEQLNVRCDVDVLRNVKCHDLRGFSPLGADKIKSYVHYGLSIPDLPLIYSNVCLLIRDSNASDGWVYNPKIFPILRNPGDMDVLRTVLDMSRENALNHTIHISPMKQNIFFQEFVQHKNEEVDWSDFLSDNDIFERRLIERDGWQFEKSWLKAKKGQSRTVRTMYRIRPSGQESWSFKVLGEKYENARSVVFTHPDIRDVNFDGHPDLHIQGVGNERDRYFSFNAVSGRFDELFISCLHNLVIDYVNQQIVGDEFVYEDGNAAPFSKVHHVLKGKHWNASTSSHQKLREPKKKMMNEMNDGYNFSQAKSGILFELYNKSTESSGTFHFLASDIESSTTLLEDSIEFDSTHDWHVKSPVLMVKDFNRDNLPDVYFPKFSPNFTEVFFMSEILDGKLNYNKRSGLNYIEQMMFCGNVKFSDNKMLFQEFEDFNLDGWLDYRRYIQVNKSNGYWSYYLYNEETLRFEYSSSFSSLDYCFVDQSSNTLIAWQESIALDGHRYFVGYELKDGMITPLSTKKNEWNNFD